MRPQGLTLLRWLVMPLLLAFVIASSLGFVEGAVAAVAQSPNDPDILPSLLECQSYASKSKNARDFQNTGATFGFMVEGGNKVGCFKVDGDHPIGFGACTGEANQVSKWTGSYTNSEATYVLQGGRMVRINANVPMTGKQLYVGGKNVANALLRGEVADISANGASGLTFKWEFFKIHSGTHYKCDFPTIPYSATDGRVTKIDNLTWLSTSRGLRAYFSGEVTYTVTDQAHCTKNNPAASCGQHRGTWAAWAAMAYSTVCEWTLTVDTNSSEGVLKCMSKLPSCPKTFKVWNSPQCVYIKNGEIELYEEESNGGCPSGGNAVKVNSFKDICGCSTKLQPIKDVNGWKCEDINECKNPELNNCAAGNDETTCVNVEATVHDGVPYKCVCPAGKEFKKSGLTYRRVEDRTDEQKCVNSDLIMSKGRDIVKLVAKYSPTKNGKVLLNGKTVPGKQSGDLWTYIRTGLTSGTDYTWGFQDKDSTAVSVDEGAGRNDLVQRTWCGANMANGTFEELATAVTTGSPEDFRVFQDRGFLKFNCTLFV
jgi:hypothetical protein